MSNWEGHLFKSCREQGWDKIHGFHFVFWFTKKKSEEHNGGSNRHSSISIICESLMKRQWKGNSKNPTYGCFRKWWHHPLLPGVPKRMLPQQFPRFFPTAVMDKWYTQSCYHVGCWLTGLIRCVLQCWTSVKAEQCILRENVEEEATPLWMDVQLHLKFFFEGWGRKGRGKGEPRSLARRACRERARFPFSLGGLTVWALSLLTITNTLE